MTTYSEAFAAIRARIEAAAIADVTLRWPNEDNDNLPDEPVAFAFTELRVFRAYPLAKGGGRGANIQRTEATIEIRVEVPRGSGQPLATDTAEAFAALFRMFIGPPIKCGAAQVQPDSAADANYFAATAVIDCHFDQEG